MLFRGCGIGLLGLGFNGLLRGFAGSKYSSSSSLLMSISIVSRWARVVLQGVQELFQLCEVEVKDGFVLEDFFGLRLVTITYVIFTIF